MRPHHVVVLFPILGGGLLVMLAGIISGTVQPTTLHAQANPSPEGDQSAASDEQTEGLREAELQLFQLVNEERRQNGLSPLGFDRELLPVARTRAADQTTLPALSHVDATGATVYTRLLDAMGIQPAVAGEALVSVSGPDANLVPFAHETLMHSEPHRRLLLDERFTCLAVGGASSAPRRLIAAEIFTSR